MSYDNAREQGVLLAGIIVGLLSKWANEHQMPWRITDFRPGIPVVLDMGGIEYEILVRVKGE